jgi:hypothetical protein
MRRQQRSGTVWLGLVAVIFAAAGLMLVNVQFSRSSPGGNDFLVHWVGARAVLAGDSPYSEATALEIQRRAYGRAALPGEHELRVAYPLYAMALFAPFALISDYTLARAAWMTALELGLFALPILTLAWLRRTPRPREMGVWLLFALTWYHGVRPLINGNAVILVTVALAAALLLLERGHLGWAGVLLALTTIKPQLAVVPLAVLGLWALRARQSRLILGLGLTLAGLVGAALIVQPDWIGANLAEVLRYPGYNPPGTLAAALAALFPGGLWVGRLISLALWLWLAGEIWRMDAAARPTPWLLALTLTVSQWGGIQTDPGNFIILLPALLVVTEAIRVAYPHRGPVRVGLLLSVLWLGLWLLFLRTVAPGPQPGQSPWMFLPLPAVLLLGLAWSRRVGRGGQVQSP